MYFFRRYRQRGQVLPGVAGGVPGDADEVPPLDRAEGGARGDEPPPHQRGTHSEDLLR